MPADVRQLQLGGATVMVINVGDFHSSLSGWAPLPPALQTPHYAALFDQPLHLPIHNIHISLPGLSVLVDACRYDVAPDNEYAIPNYQPPPGLLVRLAEAGVPATAITHVVLTHAHSDHYSATTVEQGGQFVPCFPNARHYLGLADWQDPHRQTALQDPTSIEGQTLGVLHQRGLLEFVAGDVQLATGLTLIATPGETAGHQIVKVQVAGQTLYCLGDLYHHPLEVEQPGWMCTWADVDTNRMSRRTLTEAALAEQALLVATHIPTIGRLERTPTGVTWAAI